MSKRQQTKTVKAVMASIELRDHCRALAAQRRADESMTPAVKRFTGRAMVALIFGGMALVIVLHAISLMGSAP